MSVINNLPAMPNRMAFACELLYLLGEKGDTWDNVESQLSPLKKVDEESLQEDKPTGKSMADDVLREMERLKLFDRDSAGIIKLNPEIRDVIVPNGNWQEALLPVLFARIATPEFAATYGQEEVPDALAWLLAQDPLTYLPWGGGPHVERIATQLGETDPLRTAIGNNSRYQNLIYWARYFGLAERITLRVGTGSVDMVMPDPTEAITRHLPSTFGEARDLSIHVFLQQLSVAVPVLDGGVARRNLESRFTDEYPLKEKHLSRSTSLALTRLRARGILRLECLSDADNWLLDLGQSTQPVSHVRLIAGGTS